MLKVVKSFSRFFKKFNGQGGKMQLSQLYLQFGDVRKMVRCYDRGDISVLDFNIV